MRIRKRHVLLSSQHFPVTPPSDPHLNNRSPAVVQLGDATTTSPGPSSPKQQHGSAVLSLDRNLPSDQPLPLINGLDHPSGRRQHSKQDPSIEDGGGIENEESGGEDSEERKANHSRKGRIFGSSKSRSPSSIHQDEWWCEEDKTIPFKKRRGAFHNNAALNRTNGQLGCTSSSNKKTKAKMKTKMNKNCTSSSTQKDNDDDELDDDDKKDLHEVKAAKKRGRGSALMEGSRCSRVNGRGWRCCQQTLVGYSLCEHHLGKGRLRSMTSVRSRSTSLVAAPTTNKVVVVVQQDQDDDKLLPGETNTLSSLLLLSSSPSSDDDEKKITNNKYVAVAAAESSDVNDDEKPAVVVMAATAKKRMKLGTVKARSISSLLGQTNSITTGIALAHQTSNIK